MWALDCNSFSLSSSVFISLLIIYGANEIINLDPLRHIISSISLYIYIKKTLQLPDPEILDPQHAAMRLYALSNALKSHRTIHPITFDVNCSHTVACSYPDIIGRPERLHLQRPYK